MKFAIRNVTSAVLALGVLGSAQAADFDTGSLSFFGSNTVTFTLVADTATASFTARIKPSAGGQYAPTSFALFSGTSTTPVASVGSNQILGNPGSWALSFSGLTGGEYTLEFDTPYTLGTYKLSTSLVNGSYSLGSSTTVPEAGVLVMALAGVGVLGLMGRRRMI
jgi:hypothetical protein